MVLGELVIVGDNACHGNGACTQINKAAATIGNDSCLGACAGGNGFAFEVSIGRFSCLCERTCRNIANEAAAVTIGDRSCRGHQTCEQAEGVV